MSVIGAFVSREVIACQPHERVAAAAKVMSDRNVGSILILDPARHILGIFTERDLLRKVVGAGRDPKTLQIWEVMTSPVITVDITANTEQVVQLMSETNFRHMPVLNRGEVVGVISLRSPRLMQLMMKEMHDRLGADGVHAMFQSFVSTAGAARPAN